MPPVGRQCTGLGESIAQRNDGENDSETLWRILLVALLFTIYAFTNPGRFHVVDEVSLFGVTESIALAAPSIRMPSLGRSG